MADSSQTYAVPSSVSTAALASAADFMVTTPDPREWPVFLSISTVYADLVRCTQRGPRFGEGTNRIHNIAESLKDFHQPSLVGVGSQASKDTRRACQFVPTTCKGVDVAILRFSGTYLTRILPSFPASTAEDCTRSPDAGLSFPLSTKLTVILLPSRLHRVVS